MKSGIKLFSVFVITLLLLSSCSSMLHTNKALEENKTRSGNKLTSSAPKDDSQLAKLKKAEKEADEAGREILETGRKMALEEKVIIKGSCWNWVNECFKRAGYETDKYIAYKSKKTGPYVDIDKIKPGDWIYYINYSYNKIEHSGIFVHWVDKKKKIAVTLSYGGEHRKEPGRYREYLLKDVYYITRAGKK